MLRGSVVIYSSNCMQLVLTEEKTNLDICRKDVIEGIKMDNEKQRYAYHITLFFNIDLTII